MVPLNTVDEVGFRNQSHTEMRGSMTHEKLFSMTYLTG